MIFNLGMGILENVEEMEIMRSIVIGVILILLGFVLGGLYMLLQIARALGG